MFTSTLLLLSVNNKYTPFGSSMDKYGWAAMSTKQFANRMKLANARFTHLKKQLGINAIAFSGSSGCAIAFNLAALHNIPLIYVRKKGEQTHGNRIECSNISLHIKKYLIVDDFVDTGSTVNRIIKAIKEETKKQSAYPAEAVGMLCYDSYHDRDRTIPVIGNDIFPLYSCKMQKVVD